SCDLVFFFFFQAEDGIRDDLVTGVQTCALPICYRAATCSRWPGRATGCWSDSTGTDSTRTSTCPGSSASPAGRAATAPAPPATRSEERRGGKEGSCGRGGLSVHEHKENR